MLRFLTSTLDTNHPSPVGGIQEQDWSIRDNLLVESSLTYIDNASVLDILWLLVLLDYDHMKTSIVNDASKTLKDVGTRVLLSGRILRCFVPVACVVCVFLFPLLRLSHALGPLAATEEEFAIISQVKVRVVDETGSPLSNVHLFANTMILDGKSDSKWNRDYTTDEQGRATLEISPKTASLRLWANRDDYVGLFISWETKKFPDRRQIRDLSEELNLILGKGTTIRGTVVDAKNAPIAKARVQVSLRSGGKKRDQNENSSLHSRFASVTDETGTWQVTNIPEGDDVELELTVESPNHMSVTSSSPLSKFDVTLEQLRNGTAKIQLQEGIRLKGQITNPSHEPVADAVVIWGDQPYWESGRQELKTDSLGQFELPAREPGPIRITVVAKDLMPESRIIDVQGSGIQSDFQLKPGKTLRVKFVDASGKPIEGVSMQLNKWRGAEALYNNIHSSVMPTGIPRKLNPDGVFEWTWAPDDEIEWIATKMNEDRSEAVFSKRLSLIADDSLQVITIVPACVIRGNVVNAVDGSPVTRFSITPITFSSSSESNRGLEQESYTQSFTTNSFRYSLARHEWNEQSRFVGLRFDATGYRVYETERFGLEDKPLDLTIRLEPCEPQKGWVSNFAQHKRVVVRLVRPRAGLHIGEANDYWSEMNPTLPIDASGEFSYQGQNDNYAIVAASEEGYAEKYCSKSEPVGDITLMPWASVDGTLFQEGRPVRNASVSLRPIRKLGGSNPHVQDIFWCMTDSKGHFQFTKVPPVPCSIGALLTSWEDFPITSSQSLALDLQPGEARTLNLGGDGIQLVGKVRLSGDETKHIQFRYGIHYLVRTDTGQVSVPNHARNRIENRTGLQWELMEKLLQGSGELNAMEFHSIKLNPDGSFLVNGVRPGSYRLLFQVFEPPSGCLIDPVGLKYMEFDTTDYELRNNELNLGEIEVAINPLPKVGETIPNFRWTDLAGKPVSLEDLRGKIVVLDFWASWCGPCLASLPDVAKLQSDLASDDRFRFVSLSVDSDVDAAKSMIRSKKMNWEQGIAADLTTSPSGRALGINSVPLYMMLDEDGTLLMRTTSLDQLTEHIKQVRGN